MDSNEVPSGSADSKKNVEHTAAGVDATSFRQRIDSTIANGQGDGQSELIRRKPVTIVARTNTVFGKYLPLIAAALREHGVMVEEQIFPEGTPEPSISQWAREHMDSLSHGSILCDETFWRSCEDSWKLTHRTKRRSLDGLFEHSAFNVLVKSEQMKAEEPRQQVQLALSALFRNIFRNRKPPLVAIIVNRLRSHMGYCKDDHEAAAIVKECVEQAGVDPNNISSLKWGEMRGTMQLDIPMADLERLMRVKMKTKQLPVVLLDRHASVLGDGEDFQVLRLPVENLLNDAIVKGLLTDIEPTEFEDALRTSLQEYIEDELTEGPQKKS